MEGTEKRALGYLPENLREAVTRTSSLYGRFDEIRLRLERELSVTVDGKNLLCGVKCTKADIENTVDALCQGSLYSHAEEIREGVITTDCGIRAGTAGTAVLSGGQIRCVRDISSVCIRVPHRIPGAADELYSRMNGQGVLVFSPPGCGKTTVLRELIPLIGREKRVAVIDTRHELAVDAAGELVDVFAGYPRGFGIGSAVRTMSPEVIVCDEIAGEEDVRAILEAHSAGVTVCASAHGRSVEEIRRNPWLGKLMDAYVFGLLYGRISRTELWQLIEQYSPARAVV
ncbi:MAG: hypothetical protein IJY35_01145 [Clostridia bacterium]|nr:hypothetical protein [Clostridia bacterium]